MTQQTFIIAEAGVNHNGSTAIAKDMIFAAASSGADAIKFQTFLTEELVSKRAATAKYQADNTGGMRRQYEMLKNLELSEADHILLQQCCRENNIQFLSSAFDVASVDFLDRLGVDLYKVPSGEITSLPYLRRIARTGKPVILSTGMATHDEVKSALTVFNENGYDNDRLALLHCTSDYPAPYADVNLKVMHTLRHKFGLRTGYSDHTQGIEIAIAATALGAEIIEKHFTLDQNMAGPDHLASITPDNLATMVKSIRHVEASLGDGKNRLSENEKDHRQAVRKSIVARRPIRQGEMMSEDNLTIKRPGDGISPMKWDEYIGRIASRNYQADDPIIE